MAEVFEKSKSKDGLTFKLYRGEGAALLAFDLDKKLATREFVGFSVEVRYPGSAHWGALRNRLHFDPPPDTQRPRSFKSTEAPFQKFRWIHVPTDVLPGLFRYRVSARYMKPDGTLTTGAVVENEISLDPQTIKSFVNVGFTRGFASSQAYADRFNNETGILPKPGSPALASLEHDMSPFEKNYEWLGFEARKMVLNLLTEVEQDPALTLDALIYECKEPEILRRLEALGGRLRAIVDDHGEQGGPESCETVSAERLAAAGAEVKRMHFSRQQHNKVLLVRRNGVPVKVTAGSTNFSLRGLYIQANNMLLFEDSAVAQLFGEVFDAYWDDPKGFKKNELSKYWWVVEHGSQTRVSFCFSPHADSDVSLNSVAAAIENAKSSVLYSMVFLSQISGRVREALDELMQRTTFSYGVAQRMGGLQVEKPDGSRGLLPFAYLAENAPEPFRSEWSGNTEGHSNMVHHKFVVTDFNGARPCVFTGSSNMAGSGEKQNGDHLICIEDKRIVAAYAIEALKMFDHFHFRVNAKSAKKSKPLTLARPPKDGSGKTWFAEYYRNGHVKEQDRKLFIKGG